MKAFLSDSLSCERNRALEEYFFTNNTKDGDGGGSGTDNDNDILFMYICEPSLVIGAYQNVFAEVNLPFCRKNNIKVLRRISGGGTVFHDCGNINYAYIEKKTSTGADYRHFTLRITKALQSLGVPAYHDKICDIALGGYKISGSAQKISKGRVLHHGTLLYNADLKMLKNAVKVNGNFTSTAINSVKREVGNIKDICSLDYQTKEFAEKLFYLLGAGEIKPCVDYDKVSLMEDDYKSGRTLFSRNPAFSYKNGDFTFKSKNGIVIENSLSPEFNGMAVDNGVFNKIMYGE